MFRVQCSVVHIGVGSKMILLLDVFAIQAHRHFGTDNARHRGLDPIFNEIRWETNGSWVSAAESAIGRFLNGGNWKFNSPEPLSNAEQRANIPKIRLWNHEMPRICHRVSGYIRLIVSLKHKQKMLSRSRWHRKQSWNEALYSLHNRQNHHASHVPSLRAYSIVLTSNYLNCYWWEFNFNEERRCRRLFPSGGSRRALAFTRISKRTK